MSKSAETKLFKAAALTFEELGFMFPSSELEEYQEAAPPVAAVSVEFEGPFNGRLVVTACGDLLPALVTNMLGQEGTPSEQQQQDALGEIANVICGNVLPEIAGSKEVFHLHPPQPVDCAQACHDPATECVVANAQIGLDEGRAQVVLVVNQNEALCQEQSQ
jgi:chemotaxis protein CheY-P-specific phosphatase CheC